MAGDREAWTETVPTSSPGELEVAADKAGGFWQTYRARLFAIAALAVIVISVVALTRLLAGVSYGDLVSAIETTSWRALALAILFTAVSFAALSVYDRQALAFVGHKLPFGQVALTSFCDGGWRDIDRQIAEYLASKGVPTVGIDSLRYFWSEKRPETIAADLDRIIDHYVEAWQVHKVVLIGYSFGADVLPAAYNKMTPQDQARISLLSLLGLSGSAAFEFDVSGWLGVSDETSYPTLPDVGKIAPKLVQCIYGEDDDDAVCAKLEGTGAEVVRTPGGHHFDDDYEAVAQKIIARIA